MKNHHQTITYQYKTDDKVMMIFQKSNSYNKINNSLKVFFGV